MMVYLKLIIRFIQVSLQQESAYRANFLINVLNTGLNLVAGVAGVTILFSQVPTFNGWTYPQVLALLGIYLTISALRNLVIGPSLDSLGGMDGEVWDGRFDYTLLKPVSTQFLASVSHWRLWAVIDLGLSLVILGMGISGLGAQLDLQKLLAFLTAMGVSVTLVYAISLLLTSGVFWYQGVPLIWVFDSFLQLGRYPVGIYPGWLKLVLTWVLPIGFITTVPVQLLTGQISLSFLVGGIILSMVMLVTASVFFKFSLRRYCSASS